MTHAMIGVRCCGNDRNPEGEDASFGGFAARV